LGYAWGVPPPGPLLELFAPSLVGRAGEPALDLGPPGAGPIETLTFGEIEARSNRMAHALAARGLRPGERLAVQLPNGLAFLELFLASLKLGVVFVPLNVLYREREVGHIVGDAEPTAIVTTPDLAALAPAEARVWDIGTLAEQARGEPAPRPQTDLRPGTPALVVYTSGTTGRAKGAVLTHANLAANARTLVEAWRITAADRYLAVLPLFHVHGLGNGVCGWLASGCRMRLVERFEHAQAIALFEEFRPTLVFGVPTIYVRLLEWPAETAGRLGAGVRLFVSGSAPLPVPVFEAFRARFGHAILERYGMTETLMTIGNPCDGERRPGTVGRSLAGVELRIVDADGREVGDGETGELLVRGPAVFSGYWRRPDATAAAFTSDGFFRTGDLAARASDGYVTLRGRASDLIIVGGFNVYPREIEDLLLEQPGVREAAVVGVPDPRRGEQPVACFVGEALPEALAAACRRALASFKQPRAFVRVEALPRNAMGKVDKGMLASISTGFVDQRPGE
jgi:malonyl-CoA/methylmalonyl-CoA synthetase